MLYHFLSYLRQMLWWRRDRHTLSTGTAWHWVQAAIGCQLLSAHGQLEKTEAPDQLTGIASLIADQNDHKQCISTSLSTVTTYVQKSESCFIWLYRHYGNRKQKFGAIILLYFVRSLN